MATFDSLKSPRDAKEEGKSVLRNLNHPPLTDEEMEQARESKIKNLMFPQIDRHYADPSIMNQKICLVSFIPSKNARPDEDNIYGMMKVRGVFATEEEANERAEMLIRNHDSYHEIYHAFVGRPFPVTNVDGYERELQTIDIRKKTVRLISEDIMNKKKTEETEVREMQEREQKLLDQSKRAKEELPEDPYEIYITNQVKRAQLIWTYRETMQKCKQMKDLVETTNREIAEAEIHNPEYLEQYREKYRKARLDAGLTDKADDEESFIKFLGVDQLPSLDEI